ncbi:MAG: DoxX family protein [Parafilimonas sp.]
MKKFLNIENHGRGFNIGMLLLRISLGGMLIINHGYPKLANFSTMQQTFYNFLGLGSKFSLMLVIFAELFCSIFVIIGLLTRIAIIPIIITMLVAIFGVAAGKPLPESELAFLYLILSLVLFLGGPGNISVDGRLSK